MKPKQFVYIKDDHKCYRVDKMLPLRQGYTRARPKKLRERADATLDIAQAKDSFMEGARA